MRAQRMARDAAEAGEAGEAGTQAQASALPCSAQAEPVLQRLLRAAKQCSTRRRVELHESKILPGLPTCPGKRGGTTVTDEQILQALRCLRVETGSLSCLGCGHEHRCNVHGCQILREAAAQLEHFIAENRALRSALASRPAKRAQKQARDASVTFLREMAKELNAQRAEAEVERDALLEIAKNGKDCDTCKHCNVCVQPGIDVAHWCNRCVAKCPCYGCGGDHWEWRGLPEDPEEGGKA